MRERLENFKIHVKENKKTYIACGATAVVTGVVVYVAMKTRRSVDAITTTDSNKLIDFKWHSPVTNSVTVNLTPRGDLGNPVRCLETGEIFESQNFAALVKGVSSGVLSRHLNGELAHAGGLHFERLAWNAN